VHPNKKWQESHQRQWKKVLTDPGNYYKGPGGATGLEGKPGAGPTREVE